MSLGTSKEYLEIKKMMWNEPKLLHSMLEKLAENIGEYANYQIKSGAQVIQVFDSWAGKLFIIIIIIFLLCQLPNQEWGAGYPGFRLLGW